MANHAVFSASELEHIMHILGTDESANHARHLAHVADLKASCADKVKHWPNTILARRSEKQVAATAKRETDEARRKVLDKEEAAYQAVLRSEVIKDAHIAVYRRLGEVRSIHSQITRDDVNRERAEQIAILTTQRQKKELDALLWHNRTVEVTGGQLAEEKRKAADAVARAKEVKATHVLQIEAQRAVRIRELTELKEEGRRLRDSAEDEAGEERALLSARKEKALNLNRERSVGATQNAHAKEERRAHDREVEEARVRYDTLKTQQMTARGDYLVSKVKGQVAMREDTALRMSHITRELVIHQRSINDRHDADAKVYAAKLVEKDAHDAERKKNMEALVHESRQFQLRQRKEAVERVEAHKAKVGAAIKNNVAILAAEDREHKLALREDAREVGAICAMQKEAKDKAKEQDRKRIVEERLAYEMVHRDDEELLDGYNRFIPR